MLETCQNVLNSPDDGIKLTQMLFHFLVATPLWWKWFEEGAVGSWPLRPVPVPVPVLMARRWT
jgi:hypothetical protein